MSADLERRVADLERRLAQIVRVGRVSSAAAGAGTARVVFDDTESGDTVTHDLPVLYPRTKSVQDAWTLTAGEQVVCVFLPCGEEAGFVLGAHYSTSEAPPANDPNLRVVAGAEVRVGSVAASDPVALKSLVEQQFATLKTAIENAAVVAQDGGAALKTNILAGLVGWPGNTGATRVKAE